MKFPNPICFIITVNVIMLLIVFGLFAFVNYGQDIVDLDYYIALLCLNTKQYTDLYRAFHLILAVIFIVAAVGVTAAVIDPKWMYAYYLFIVVISLIMAILLIGCLGVMMYVLYDLKQLLYTLMAVYEVEFQSFNYKTGLFDILQVIFSACGVEGIYDWADKDRAPMWKLPEPQATTNPEMYWPLSCCPQVAALLNPVPTDQWNYMEVLMQNMRKDNYGFDQCYTNPFVKGIYPEMKMFLKKLITVTIMFIVLNVLFFGHLIFASSTVIKNLEEEYGKKKGRRNTYKWYS